MPQLADEDPIDFLLSSHAHGVFDMLVVHPSDALFFSLIITNVLSEYGEGLRTGLEYPWGTMVY